RGPTPRRPWLGRPLGRARPLGEAASDPRAGRQRPGRAPRPPGRDQHPSAGWATMVDVVADRGVPDNAEIVAPPGRPLPALVSGTGGNQRRAPGPARRSTPGPPRGPVWVLFEDRNANGVRDA